MDDVALHQALHAALNYDATTGAFIWKVTRGGAARAGSPAGATDSKGHRQIRFQRKLYLAHRLAWFMTYGRWPIGEIDHINRERSDNRLANLRECSHAENSRNRSSYSSNTSGAQGVSWYSRYGKWMAYIGVDGRHKTLGYFANKGEAIAARRSAEVLYYGKFAPQRDKPLPGDLDEPESKPETEQERLERYRDALKDAQSKQAVSMLFDGLRSAPAWESMSDARKRWAQTAAKARIAEIGES